MVAGRLQEKNGFYYIVLSYTDSAGKRRQPWIGTGPVSYTHLTLPTNREV